MSEIIPSDTGQENAQQPSERETFAAYIQIPGPVFYSNTLTDKAKPLYGLLNAMSQAPRYYAFPRNRTLMKYLDCSERRLQGYLAELRDAGELTIENGEGGRQLRKIRLTRLQPVYPAKNDGGTPDKNDGGNKNNRKRNKCRGKASASTQDEIIQWFNLWVAKQDLSEKDSTDLCTDLRDFAENRESLGKPFNTIKAAARMGNRLGIYNVLQRCPAKVTAYIDGFAASAASVIAMAADTVVMPRNTAMMIHNAAWWAYGNPEALRKSADDLEVINMAAIQSYVVHAGDKLDRDRLRQMLDEETWLTAEECVACGLADQFAEQEVDVQTAAQQYQAAAAAAKDREAAMYRNPPAFLAGVLPAEAEPVQEKKEDSRVKNSSIYLLLKNITKNMEE